MPEKIEITVNQSGKELQQRYPDQIKLVNRPPGVNFYSVDWPRESLGSVQLNAGPRPLTIDAALGLSGSDDPNFPAENILEWHIYAGLGNEEEIAQDDARQRFFAILQKIRNAGWQRYIGRGHPRLKGADALRYAQRSAVYAQDPDYRPTLEQWMAMDDRSLWRFHADQAYMTVALTRDAARKGDQWQGRLFHRVHRYRCERRSAQDRRPGTAGELEDCPAGRIETAQAGQGKERRRTEEAGCRHRRGLPGSAHPVTVSAPVRRRFDRPRAQRTSMRFFIDALRRVMSHFRNRPEADCHRESTTLCAV